MKDYSTMSNVNGASANWKEHAASPDCWCKPTLDGDIWVHNEMSMDDRVPAAEVATLTVEFTKVRRQLERELAALRQRNEELVALLREANIWLGGREPHNSAETAEYIAVCKRIDRALEGRDGQV